jgi:hypothetical protein
MEILTKIRYNKEAGAVHWQIGNLDRKVLLSIQGFNKRLAPIIEVPFSFSQNS